MALTAERIDSVNDVHLKVTTSTVNVPSQLTSPDRSCTSQITKFELNEIALTEITDPESQTTSKNRRRTHCLLLIARISRMNFITAYGFVNRSSVQRFRGLRDGILVFSLERIPHATVTLK